MSETSTVRSKREIVIIIKLKGFLARNTDGGSEVTNDRFILLGPAIETSE